MSIEEVNKELHTMKEYARNNNVPIMQDEGIDFVKNFMAGKDNIQAAFADYVQSVKNGTFPAQEHWF